MGKIIRLDERLNYTTNKLPRRNESGRAVCLNLISIGQVP